MSIRSQHITAQVGRFLDRFSPPANLKGNEQATADTRAAIVRAISRMLPSDGFTDQLTALLDEIENRAETRAWPTVFEVNRAAQAIAKAGVRAPSQVKLADPVTINANRITAGEPVSGDWLFGRRARRLLDAGVTKASLDAYRDGAFQHHAEVYGEEAARAWAAAMKARHADELAADSEERRMFATGEIVRSAFRSVARMEWD